MVGLEEAARRLQDFEGQSLTARLAALESVFRGADQRQASQLCASEKLDSALLESAIELKRVAGQINVLIHAAGILAALPSILEESEIVQGLSLGAGNTGRDFDLETNRRVAEFKFIRWRGGPEAIRQNSLFKDFYALSEAETTKARYLYVLGLEHPLKFLMGGRALQSVMSRNDALLADFRGRYGNRFRVVREYYEYRRDQVKIVDLVPIVPELGVLVDEFDSDV